MTSILTGVKNWCSSEMIFDKFSNTVLRFPLRLLGTEIWDAPDQSHLLAGRRTIPVWLFPLLSHHASYRNPESCWPWSGWPAPWWLQDSAYRLGWLELLRVFDSELLWCVWSRGRRCYRHVIVRQSQLTFRTYRHTCSLPRPWRWVVELTSENDE